MKGNMTFKRARKLNAVFLLLLFATDHTASNATEFNEENQENFQGRTKDPEYFEDKLKEFERNKYRF